MSIAAPRYLLFSDTQRDDSDLAGGWSFVLESLDGAGRIEVSDQEPDVRGERLKLLSVIRGLEALEQPSKVTLITPNRFIGRGMRSGLTSWKENQWQWERFGVMTPIKNADLWQRIDRANEFHQIDCRVWNFQNLFESLGQISNRWTNPRMKNHRQSSNKSLNSNSWTDVASAIATRVIPTQQVYGCA
ncbi:MAG: RNase H family protein [Planctomycetota bacterium]